MTVSETIRRLPENALRRAGPRWLAVGASAFLVTVLAAGIWAWATGTRADKPAQRLASPIGALTQVIHGSTGERIVAAGPEGRVAVWDVPGVEPQALDQLSQAPVTALAMSSTGFLLAGTTENSIVGWQLGGSGEETLKVPKFPAPVSACAVRPDRMEVAVGLADGSMFFFAKGQKPKRFLSRHAGGVRSIRYHPDGNLFVTGGADGRLIWRDADSLHIRGARKAHTNDISGLAFSDDGALLASGDYDGWISVRDPVTKEPLFEFRQPEAVAGVVFAGPHLVTGSWDGWLRFWSLDSQSTIGSINTGQPIHAMAVVRDGAALATVHNTSEVLLWDLPAE